MTLSRYNILLAGIIALQVIGLTVVLVKLDSGTSKTQASDAERLAETVIAELKQLKTATQTIDTSPAIAAVSAPDAEQLRKVIRQVLEKELAEVLASASKQDLHTSNQIQTGLSPDNSQPARFRGKSEKPLSSEQLQRREEAMSQSTTIIDEAISSGSWDAGFNEKIMPYINDLSDEQRIELLERFYGALNDQTLTLKDGMPPPL